MTTYGGYESSGKGTVATEGELDSKFASYELNNQNREQTEEMKQRMRAIEQQKAELRGTDAYQAANSQQEKEGFFQKIRRGSKEKIEALTERRRSSTADSSGRRQSSNTPASATAPPAQPEHRDVHIVQEGSDPNAPTLVVKEAEQKY